MSRTQSTKLDSNTGSNSSTLLDPKFLEEIAEASNESFLESAESFIKQKYLKDQDKHLL
jgi:hypothetical protein